MSQPFDTKLIEVSHITSRHLVDVYKIGGGTIGRSYSGSWGYRVRDAGKVIASGEDLSTGMPVTHVQAANLASEMTAGQTNRKAS